VNLQIILRTADHRMHFRRTMLHLKLLPKIMVKEMADQKAMGKKDLVMEKTRSDIT
jgi:hypothetical protein